MIAECGYQGENCGGSVILATNGNGGSTSSGNGGSKSSGNGGNNACSNGYYTGCNGDSGGGNSGGTRNTPDNPVINPPNSCQKPTDCLVPPPTPVATGPILIPATPAPPWGTPTPMFYGPVTTAIAFTGNACSSTSPNETGCAEAAGTGADAIAFALAGVPPGRLASTGKFIDSSQTAYSIFSQNPFSPPSQTQGGIIQGSFYTGLVIPIAIPAVLLVVFFW